MIRFSFSVLSLITSVMLLLCACGANGLTEKPSPSSTITPLPQTPTFTSPPPTATPIIIQIQDYEFRLSPVVEIEKAMSMIPKEGFQLLNVGFNTDQGGLDDMGKIAKDYKIFLRDKANNLYGPISNATGVFCSGEGQKVCWQFAVPADVDSLWLELPEGIGIDIKPYITPLALSASPSPSKETPLPPSTQETATTAPTGASDHSSKALCRVVEVLLADRFPPACQQGSFACTMAREGNVYLTIFLESDNGASQLSKLEDAYVVDRAGNRTDLSSGLVDGRLFLGQLVPRDSNGFILYCPGMEPFLLGK